LNVSTTTIVDRQLHINANKTTSDIPMIIAIASTRAPKVKAVEAAMKQIEPYLNPNGDRIEFVPRETSSGVDETPTSIEHLMTGAKNRAKELFRQLKLEQNTDFAVGLEGGLWQADRVVFLQSWAYVTDGTKGSFGASGAIPIPQYIAHAVLVEHRSLAEVIDIVANQSNVRGNQGAWGVLSRDLITRQQSFESAVLAAMAPFYNRAPYEFND
jgi:inosine/xanthosine triphosphatase